MMARFEMGLRSRPSLLASTVWFITVSFVAFSSTELGPLLLLLATGTIDGIWRRINPFHILLPPALMVVVIGLSYGVIEPLFGKAKPIELLIQGTTIALRMSVISIASIVWVLSLEFGSFLALCSRLPLGRPIFVFFLAIRHTLKAVAARWSMIREALSVHSTGSLKERNRIKLRALPYVFGILLLATLSGIIDITGNANGRAFNNGRFPWKEPVTNGMVDVFYASATIVALALLSWSRA
jgi:hypothetical protein